MSGVSRVRPSRGWLAVYLAISLILTGCATVPITGRSQINMISNQHMVSAADATFANFMGVVQQKNLALSRSESPQAAALLESVQRVSDRIIDASGMRGSYNWQTVVVKAREANAFVMPNGKIVVFTGLLSVAKTEVGLAAVLGHEVGHVMARHGAERMSQTLLAQIAVAAVDVALAVTDSKYQPVVSAALGLGAHYGVLLPFSRQHESEADRIGLILMAKAGYDPAEAVGLWERMEAAGGSGPWEFLSTHPSPETRRARLREWLAEANLYYTDSTRPLPTNLAEMKTAHADHTAKVALAPVALQPSLQPGFWYRTKASNQPSAATSRLDRLEPCSAGDCMIYETEGGGRTVQTSDHALVELRRPDKSWTRFSPPLRVIRWPLKVGDSWSEAVVIENSSGRRVSTQVKGDVVSYESVSVPAGSFMAYKIAVTLGGRRFAETWYASDARTLVRVISYDARGNGNVTELVEYQKSPEPGGIKPDQTPSTPLN